METTIIQDYERQRLLEYADSFRELADSFQNFKTEEENEKIMQAEGTRGVIFWERQLSEQRSVFAGQLQEMSRMLFDIASQERSVEKISEKKYRQLVREMKSEGILVGDLFYIRAGEICMRILPKRRCCRAGFGKGLESRRSGGFWSKNLSLVV